MIEKEKLQVQGREIVERCFKMSKEELEIFVNDPTQIKGPDIFLDKVLPMTSEINRKVLKLIDMEKGREISEEHGDTFCGCVAGFFKRHREISKEAVGKATL